MTFEAAAEAGARPRARPENDERPGKADSNFCCSSLAGNDTDSFPNLLFSHPDQRDIIATDVSQIVAVIGLMIWFP